MVLSFSSSKSKFMFYIFLVSRKSYKNKDVLWLLGTHRLIYIRVLIQTFDNDVGVKHILRGLSHTRIENMLFCPFLGPLGLRSYHATCPCQSYAYIFRRSTPVWWLRVPENLVNDALGKYCIGYLRRWGLNNLVGLLTWRLNVWWQ